MLTCGVTPGRATRFWVLLVVLKIQVVRTEPPME
jgi:hypothetical protein